MMMTLMMMQTADALPQSAEMIAFDSKQEKETSSQNQQKQERQEHQLLLL